jgi:hypothetical protein
MSEIAKEVNLPEPVELTDAELSAVAGGAPNGDITPSTEVVTINPTPIGGDPTLGPDFESKKKKTVTSPYLTITIEQATIT